MTSRRLISSGSAFEKVGGYSRAVTQDDWCWVSGTTGYDYAKMEMPESLEAQARNARLEQEAAKELEPAGLDVAVLETLSPCVTVMVNVASPSDVRPVAAAQFAFDTVNPVPDRDAVIVDTSTSKPYFQMFT